MKCVKCNSDLERLGDFYACTNPHCPLCGDKNMWQELIRLHKALELAKDTLHWYDDNYDSVVAHETITEIEQEVGISKMENPTENISKALEVAIDALKEQQRWFGVIRVSLISHLNNEYGTLFKNYDADPTVVNIKQANDILNRALDKITELTKGGDNE